VQLILEDTEMDGQAACNIASALSHALSKQFNDRVFPRIVNDEYVLPSFYLHIQGGPGYVDTMILFDLEPS